SIAKPADPPENYPMQRIRSILLIAGVCALLAVCCFPYIQVIRDEEGWIESSNQITQISQAIRAYHEVFGHLPPAVVKDNQGQPLYSWRVLLLPFLEQDALYKEFHLDEPW